MTNRRSIAALIALASASVALSFGLDTMSEPTPVAPVVAQVEPCGGDLDCFLRYGAGGYGTDQFTTDDGTWVAVAADVVSPAVFDRLLALGYTGDPTDGLEAVYAPQSVVLALAPELDRDGDLDLSDRELGA